jgi:Putative MetA-pathway of phenol degradation
LRLAALLSACAASVLGAIVPALAGPPYLTDDPEPTDYRHFEIYTFMNGTATQDGASGEIGGDFNYGAAPNLQLTATVPAGYNFPSSGPSAWSLGNIELAAKYRFLTQQNFGLDVAVFPRVFLPSASASVGEQHASFLFPLWVERDWGQWSAFGGGGCELNRGGNSETFCLTGAVVSRQITPSLQVGLELYHQTPATQGGEATTSIGAGIRYDLSDNFHLLGYLGRGIQNADQTDRYNWYTAILFTF